MNLAAVNGATSTDRAESGVVTGSVPRGPYNAARHSAETSPCDGFASVYTDPGYRT